MRSDHKTQFLFLHPENAPTELPVEDEITKKVDYIFSTLEPNNDYRGFHTTKFGKISSSSDYEHPSLPLVSNSLATFYIRHHRKDVSEKELKWIDELYNILQNIEEYYNIPDLDVYYIKIYNKEIGYGRVNTNLIKFIGEKENLQNLLKNKFFKILTEEEFERLKIFSKQHGKIEKPAYKVEMWDILQLKTFTND